MTSFMIHQEQHGPVKISSSIIITYIYTASKFREDNDWIGGA